MRTLSSGHMFNAANKCGWDDEQKMTVYCSHIATIIPGGDFDKLFESTKNWLLDSGIEIQLVLLSLAHVIDQIESAPDYRGERFEDYLKSLMEVSGAKTTTDEAKKPEATKGRKGRKGKRAATKAKVQMEQEVQTGPSATVAVRSEAKEKPPQKFPTGTVSTPKPETALVSAPPPPPAPVVSADPPKVMLVGHLDQSFADVTKQLLAMETPLKDQRLGVMMAQQKFALPNGAELVLELFNSRPKPGVDVFIRKDGKSLAQLDQPVRKYSERYAITYQGTIYKVLPPGG